MLSRQPPRPACAHAPQPLPASSHPPPRQGGRAQRQPLALARRRARRPLPPRPAAAPPLPRRGVRARPRPCACQSLSSTGCSADAGLAPAPRGGGGWGEGWGRGLGRGLGRKEGERLSCAVVCCRVLPCAAVCCRVLSRAVALAACFLCLPRATVPAACCCVRRACLRRVSAILW